MHLKERFLERIECQIMPNNRVEATRRTARLTRNVKYQDIIKTSELNTNDLTDAEQALFDSLPGPPVSDVIRSTTIWIIEWLPSNEQPTGRLLHKWMQERSSGWSVYSKCAYKKEVLSSIDRATSLANRVEGSSLPLTLVNLHQESTADLTLRGLQHC